MEVLTVANPTTVDEVIADGFSRTAYAMSLRANEHLLALRGLRSLWLEADPGYREVIDKALDTFELRTLRLAWELFTLLTEGAEVDPHEILVQFLPCDVIEVVECAMFGPEGIPR